MGREGDETYVLCCAGDSAESEADGSADLSEKL